MNERQIHLDYHTFSSQYRVRLSEGHTRLLLENYDYPDGWQPREAPLFIRYPDAYPRMQPAIYIPENLHYTQGPVVHRMQCKFDGWKRWCTHHIPWERFELVTTDDNIDFMDVVRASLAHPSVRNPLQDPAPKSFLQRIH
ncbi:hypothetical protein [Halomontanus rarus]|uniref:hypothetical protein n=1 Tax=Halomontanus rarus TaxID=3034020 RepID=UPI001A998E86